MTTTDLCAAFGVGESTVHAKARVIEKSLRTGAFDPKWALPSLVVNAGEKMHRRAGVKMHHGRTGAGADARHSFKQRHPELSFPVRSMSLLSRPDLASPWPRRAT